MMVLETPAICFCFLHNHMHVLFIIDINYRIPRIETVSQAFLKSRDSGFQAYHVTVARKTTVPLCQFHASRSSVALL